VAARYVGYWYSIDPRDIDSKDVLTMLDVMLMLKAGGVPSSGPVLTLPASR
jgi:hypothetical protein